MVDISAHGGDPITAAHTVNIPAANSPPTGVTSTTNAAPTTPPKTRKRWRTKRAINGRNHTIRSDGSIILPVGTRPPTFPGEDPDDNHTPQEVAELEQRARQRAAARTAA